MQLIRLLTCYSGFMGSPRRTDIDAAKGLAILLVVFGHLVARADPAGVHWYEPLRRAVYAFHMPFFLYLSGMVAVLSGAVLAPLSGWPKLCASRATRLLVPFFGLGLLIICGKLIAAHFMFVDNLPATLGAGLASLVWHTAVSPALSIWYLFVLFVVTLATPLLLRGQARRWPLLTGVFLLLYLLPLPAYIYLDHIGRYAVFFALGVIAAVHETRWLALVDRIWPALFIALLLVLAGIAAFGAAWPPALTLLPVGALSMPALHGLVRRFSCNTAQVFLFLGRYSFMIYLFNTLFIGLAKGLLLRLTFWDGPHFPAFALALMAAGTLGPIMLKHLVFRPIRTLDRLTD
jgi:fucose 4-O-acetylase-like acetyltransferase